jgi:TonB family protein
MKLATLPALLAIASLGSTPSYGQSIAEAAQLQAQRLAGRGTPSRPFTNIDALESTGTITLSTGSATTGSGGLQAAQPTLEDFSPARHNIGSLPPLPANVVGGGQVFLEVTVGADGRVTAITPLRVTPPFTELMTNVVTNWSFLPAEIIIRHSPNERPVRERVESRVLVAGQFRAPAIYVGTLGEIPRTVAAASNDVPAPQVTVEPPHAMTAYGSGVVLVEVRIDRTGAVSEASLVHAAPPYDQLALSAARQWRFNPARVAGQSVDSVAYLIFGFPIPVTPCSNVGTCS